MDDTLSDNGTTAEQEKPSEKQTKKIPKNKKKYCRPSKSSSHTQFFKQKALKTAIENSYENITRDEYLGISESMSSTDTFHCLHGPEGKKYSEKGLLKRNVLKNLDPIPIDPQWTEGCAASSGWELAQTLAFLVRDPTAPQQTSRLLNHIRDFAQLAKNGLRINVLDSVCEVLDYLTEGVSRQPVLAEGLEMLLRLATDPVLLSAASDVSTHFDKLQLYMGVLGYLMMRLESDEHFELAAAGLLWQVSAEDGRRGKGAVRRRHALTAASQLAPTVARMLALASDRRFPAFQELAMLLACDSTDNCLEMMKGNVLESIMYRFNPYFPRDLPLHHETPADPQDPNLTLGASSMHMSTTISLLLVLMRTTMERLKKDPSLRLLLPCPDSYAQRCWMWVYRYECVSRHHRRLTLTVLLSALLEVYRDRLTLLATDLMPDILSLSVATEVPARPGWTEGVIFGPSQQDVAFKLALIHLSVQFLRTITAIKFMVESRHWLLGLMYLLDPGLSCLRVKWSSPLYGEIRKTVLQALVATLHVMPWNLAHQYGLIRRLLWYIEWYTESPYELSSLYWCVRLLRAASYRRPSTARAEALTSLFDTHGIIILMNLCKTLLGQRSPPVEKSQAVLSVCLRLLTSAVEGRERVTCCVYPALRWPAGLPALVHNMLDAVRAAMDNQLLVSDRWLISLLNLMWEGIVWNVDYRLKFIKNEGVYKLMDIISMSRPAVQCIALGVLADAAKEVGAVGYLVSWRAPLGASNSPASAVRRGSTIAALLAAIFRDELRITGVILGEHGLIPDLDNPIMPLLMRQEMAEAEFRYGKHSRSSESLAAADLAGSRMSKVFALLHLLSEDLQQQVAVADEAYNLYRHIQLSLDDEVTLILCSNYLTLKTFEAWAEVFLQCPNLEPEDDETFQEFSEIARGWTKEVRRQQEHVIEQINKQERSNECSLYDMLSRVRLCTALDALVSVRAAARAADRKVMVHGLLRDAVAALNRRQRADASLIRTYAPPLDEQNMTGQNVKIINIEPKTQKLTPQDNKLNGAPVYFLWRYLKEKVFTYNPRTVDSGAAKDKHPS